MNVTTITAYTFNAAGKAITFTGINPITIEQVKSVVNITRGVVYFNPEDPALGGTAAGSVLVFEAATTGHADLDKLEILYELNPDSNSQPVTGPLTNTQLRASAVPVSMSTAPLPTDAATETSQGVGNAYLGDILTQLQDMEGKQDSEIGTTQNVVAAIEQGVGLIADAAAPADNSNRSLISLFKRYLEQFTLFVAKLPGSIGTKTSAASFPVVLSSDGTYATSAKQDTIIGHVDGIESALTTLNTKDFATSAKQDAQTTLLTTIRDNADTIEASFTTLNAKDFATSAKQDSLLTELQGKADLTENQPVRHSGVATYMLATAAFTPGAAPTDVFIINGSGTKTVKVLRIILSGTQTTGGNINHISLIKRSTANSGGTSASATIVPVDANSAAATATAIHYTANPTPGSTVGTLYNPRMTIVAPATVAAFAAIFDFNSQDILNGTPIVLRGTAQGLAVNMGGTLPSGAANFSITAIITEE